MCGIFAIVNDLKGDAANTVLDGLKKLEYRGYDSWGIAIKPENTSRKREKLAVEKHIGKIGDAKTTLPSGKIAIGHTRWATHGGVTDDNAHPHLDCLGRLAVIHNGIVENYLNFKERLVKSGHRFSSETDTEVVAHIIEEKLKTIDLTTAVFDSFNELTGSNAIGVLDGESETIVACRNGSPLVVGVDENHHRFFLGSDVPAFLRYTNKVYFLEDNEGVVIDKQGVRLYDLKTKREKPLRLRRLDWNLEDAEKSGFPHFLIKEIHEQKQTIEKAAMTNQRIIGDVAKIIRENYKVVFIGCGSASYCALAGKYFFAKAGIETQTYGAYEYLPFSTFADDKTLVIAISQSGETADTLIALKQAKKNRAKICAVVNARGSTMERLADFIIPVGAGPEIAVVSTKAFTAQLISLYMLSMAVNNKVNQAMTDVKRFSNHLRKWLSVSLIDSIIEKSKSLMDMEHIYVIGKHLNFPGALEFALKLKESSYIHAEPFAAGELKHGVITLIQKDTPCFVLASIDEVKGEILSSAAELKARGGRIIGVAPFESDEFDCLIKTPDAGDLTFIYNIIVGQLLGYYLGVGRGADPDKPRNLAKSVTVK